MSDVIVASVSKVTKNHFILSSVIDGITFKTIYPYT